MSMQTAHRRSLGRSRRAASAAQIRRRQLVGLLTTLAMAAVACMGIAALWRGMAPLRERWRIGVSHYLTNPRDILLIGLDRSGAGARGNLFMVAHLDAKANSVALISVPFQTQTTLAGYGIGRIADAPLIGKVSLTRSAVETLLGTSLSRAVVFDPASERLAAAAIGPLAIQVCSPIRGKQKSAMASLELAVGKQLLAGEQVAAYLAYQSTDSGDDISRIHRQQYLVLDFARQARKSPRQVDKLLSALLSGSGTDLSLSEASEIASFLLSGPDVRLAVLPGNAGFGGAWIPNPARTAGLLRRISQSPGHRTAAKAPLAEILFNPLREKTASTLAGELTDQGVTVVRTAPNEEAEPTHVVCRDSSGRLDATVRRLLPQAPWILSDDPSPYSADYTITVGADSP